IVIGINWAMAIISLLQNPDFVRDHLLTRALVGSIAMLAGLAMHIGPVWGHVSRLSKKDRFIPLTIGAYEETRHPIYVGYHWTIFGLLLIFSNWQTAGLGLAWWLATLFSSIQEERFLIRLHGDEYRSYWERTPRFTQWSYVILVATMTV